MRRTDIVRSPVLAGRALDLRGLPAGGAEHAHRGKTLQDVEKPSAHLRQARPELLVPLVRLVPDHDHAHGKEHRGEHEHETRDPVQREDHGENGERKKGGDCPLRQVVREQ